MSGTALAQSDEADDESEDSTGAPSAAPDDNSPDDTARKAERLQKRRERLDQGVIRLRERAAELRKKAANGEAPKTPPNSKRPPKSFEEQAQKLEEQARKMEARSKNLDINDPSLSSRPDRFTGNARQRRHQIRRASINRRWGAVLRNPEAIAELKAHAERTAKLKRIRALASKKSKEDPAAKRASLLLGKEEDRHERRMKAFQEKNQGAQGTTAPATSEDSK